VWLCLGTKTTWLLLGNDHILAYNLVLVAQSWQETQLQVAKKHPCLLAEKLLEMQH